MIELEDFTGAKFAEGDYVVFGDSYMSLRIAKVRGIKKVDGSDAHRVALEIVRGMAVGKKRYSRMYNPHDFYKVDYTTTGDEL